MTVRLFILPTQYDIIDFRLGNRPENIIVRDFAGEAEVEAYRDGIEAVGDEYGRIEGLAPAENVVSYTLCSEDPESEAHAKAVAREFATPAEAAAFCRGIADAEGLMAPLLVDDTDDRFELLLEWTAGPQA